MFFWNELYQSMKGKAIENGNSLASHESGGKTNSLRIITKDIRFVHKMYVRSEPIDFPCFRGDFLFFDREQSPFGFLDEKLFCIVNLYYKIHIGGTKKWHS